MQMTKLKIAVIGQSVFGANVYSLLKENGHEIVGVFTVPDKGGREDPLASTAAKDGVPVFKWSRWRLKGKVKADIMEQYSALGADLNVLPFCTQFIPIEIITFPKHQSIVYHPSLLPRHRGASSINWTLIQGDAKTGFTIFWADDGLDTGPILLTKECDVDPNDTVNTLYRRFMFSEGIKAMGEAVELIASGKAPKIVQPEEGATYDAHISAKPELAEIDWNQPALALHNFIRGCDKVPGAWSKFDGQKVTFFGSSLWKESALPVDGNSMQIPELINNGQILVYQGGMLLPGNDGKYVNVSQLQLEDGRGIPASKFGQQDEAQTDLELNEEEIKLQDTLNGIWRAILNVENVSEDTDFFKCGAGSMDVTRLVEEVKQKCGGLELQNEDVYMGPAFQDFVRTVVLKSRGDGGSTDLKFDAVSSPLFAKPILNPNIPKFSKNVLKIP